jgi:ankyrin repeat protein
MVMNDNNRLLGADCNARNYDSETPLFFAVRGNFLEIIDELLLWNADVNAFK